MRAKSPWTPRLTDDQTASASTRLIDALADDILEGTLRAGDRLPAHRDLADALRMGVGTVTKAYSTLERRGLVRSVKGSGMFVALTQQRRGPLIDLSRNIPPAVMSERVLSSTLTAIAKRVDVALFNDYPPLGGHDEHRRILARWFGRLGVPTDPRQLVLTGGAHQAIALALTVACGRTGTVFTETHTYPGLFALTRQLGMAHKGIAMDEEGLRPEALEAAWSEPGPGPRVLYVTPTMQNPTTATMTHARRQDIVALCRGHDVLIIEDDVYTLAADPSLPALALLAPERTFYTNSLSKTLNPTLRIGALVSPPSYRSAVETAMQAALMMAAPLSCAVMEQWLLDGTIDAVNQSIRHESTRRMAMARQFLTPWMRHTGQPGYHVWLPMPQRAAQRLADAASALGVLVTPPASTCADPHTQEGGLRVCLGAPDLPDLSTALSGMARLIEEIPVEATTRLSL